MKVSKGTTLNCEHTLARSILSLPSSPPHPPRPLLSLIFPPSSFIKKNRRSLYPFWSLLCPPPPLIRILFPNAQSRTRTRVYASLLEHLAICATAPSSTPLLHTHRAPAVPIFPTFSVSIYSHPSIFSDSAYPGPLHRILLKLSNTHHPNPCVGGSRRGRRGNGPCCPCVDYPRCEHGPPGV